jgi:histidine ammonia-lyase
VETFLKPYRSVVSFIEDDRLMADDIHASVAFLQSMDVDTEILFG